MYKFNIVDKIAFLLVILGAINWGLISLFKFNLVSAVFKIFGSASNTLQSILYLLVGVSGVYILFLVYKLKTKKQ